MVRFTVTNHSGSMIPQITLKVCCWLAEDRLTGPQVCYERRAEDLNAYLYRGALSNRKLFTSAGLMDNDKFQPMTDNY